LGKPIDRRRRRRHHSPLPPPMHLNEDKAQLNGQGGAAGSQMGALRHW
jgi:hypothetical protein